MKKVLVTGATGFLGKYVVEELVEHGYQVRAFGRNRTIGQSLVNASVTFIQGDLTNQEDLTMACQEMDMVVHAGALSTVWGPWEDFYRTNVLGCFFLPPVLRFLYTSSSARSCSFSRSSCAIRCNSLFNDVIVICLPCHFCF